jgi:hypothetical protein
MADAILTPRADAAPPLDTVLLWLTTTVERDFDERGAFPRLRHAHAKAYRGAATLHYLTADEAEKVLEDATVREQSVRRGTRNAYAAHIKSIQAAMKEAAERPSVFASLEPVSTYKSEHAERWRGTKEQLKAHGIQLGGPWPNEPGGKERWAQARDSRGYKTSITRVSTIWPGLYEAYITMPREVWGAKHNSKPTTDQADLAGRSLASMPKSADDFRAHLVDSMRFMARFHLEQAVKAATWHGYTLDEDSVDEIHASFDAVVEAVVGAKVNFDAALHAQIAQKYRAQMAGADTAFQAQFQALVRPNPGILEGGAQ